MSPLNPKAEQLVRAGRAALRPNEADRQRVLEAMLPRLNPAPGPPPPLATSSASVPASSVAVRGFAVLIGAALVTGGLFLARRSQRAAIMTGPPAVATPVATPASPVDRPSESTAPAIPEGGPGIQALPSRPADRLAQEVAILSRASADLHAGRPAAALTALDEHQRRFPAGVLAEERVAARIQALCALGRGQEARAELARLARTAASSPLLARARAACESALGQGDSRR